MWALVCPSSDEFNLFRRMEILHEIGCIIRFR